MNGSASDHFEGLGGHSCSQRREVFFEFRKTTARFVRKLIKVIIHKSEQGTNFSLLVTFFVRNVLFIGSKYSDESVKMTLNILKNSQNNH